MKLDIIISGVGGQGILSIARIIGVAALSKNLFLKQAEVHGMSQRGGDVQSHLRISDEEIYSDLIPKGGADMILSVEPMEALRYVEYLSPKGWIVSNKKIFNNISNYPEEEYLFREFKKFPNTLLLDADNMAKTLENTRGMNMVMVGAASKFMDLIEYECLENGIKDIFGSKGEKVVNLNLACLRAGREFADSNIDK